MAKHSLKCCDIKVFSVKKDGLMRPKAFLNAVLTCDKLPGIELNRYILQRSLPWWLLIPFGLIRLRLWCAERELLRMATGVSRYLDRLEARKRRAKK
jgi:hypothetical protein